MELWIRTQDKKDLIKVDYISYEIAIEDKHILWYKSIDLGTYETKERALEVLDEIQNVLKPQQYEVPTGRGTFTTLPNISNYVYEMPKD